MIYISVAQFNTMKCSAAKQKTGFHKTDMEWRDFKNSNHYFISL